jgi:hypothetical protein
LAIGLTVMAFFVGGLFEVFFFSKYRTYRKEWEAANNLSGEDGRMDG